MNNFEWEQEQAGRRAARADVCNGVSQPYPMAREAWKRGYGQERQDMMGVAPLRPRSWWYRLLGRLFG